MAKRRSTGTRDRLPNEHRFTVDTASDSSTIGAAGSNALIETGMIIGQGQSIVHKWWLLGCSVQPELPADMPSIVVTGICQFQLALGDHTADTAFLAHTDPQRICSMEIGYEIVGATGGGSMQWPIWFPLPYPKPVLAKEITFTMATNADNANWDNAQTFGVTMYYLTDTVKGMEVAEMLASYGTI